MAQVEHFVLQFDDNGSVLDQIFDGIFIHGRDRCRIGRLFIQVQFFGKWLVHHFSGWLGNGGGLYGCVAGRHNACPLQRALGGFQVPVQALHAMTKVP